MSAIPDYPLTTDAEFARAERNITDLVADFAQAEREILRLLDRQRELRRCIRRELESVGAERMTVAGALVWQPFVTDGSAHVVLSPDVDEEVDG